MTDATLPPNQSILAHFPLPQVRPWRELAVLGVMIMGLSWGVPWFRSLTQSTYALSSSYTFSTLLGMLLAAYLLVRALTHFRLKLPIRRGARGVLLVVSVLIGLKTLLYPEESVSMNDLVSRPLLSFSDATALIPDEFIIIMTVLLVWRWGVNLAHENIEPLQVVRTFRAGALMFVVFIFFNTFATGETFGRMAHLFLFAGLIAMGAARVDSISSLRGGRESPFDRRWLVGLLLTVLGTVGIAAWIAAGVSGEETFMGFLPRLVIGVVVAVGFLLFTPVFLLFYYGLYAVVNLLRPEGELAETLEETMEDLQRMSAGFLDFIDKYLEPVGAVLSRFAPRAKSLVLWGVVFLLAAAIVLAVIVRDRHRRARMREEGQSILGRGGLLGILRDAFQKRMQEAANRLAQAADLRRRRRQLAAARIRRIYTQLMELCENLQHPRPEAQTPL
ncbi:MAG: hypothetical protein ACE5GO_12590, partial [Anaerolineales bacterium]